LGFIVVVRLGFILVYNHPSGNATPSVVDITITKKIVEAGKLFDIAVLDHLIIAAGYYSFADNGMT
jgi:DNA repair protein RadC